jgi:hypothetical protein
MSRFNDDKEPVEITVEVRREAHKAIQVYDGRRTEWIPISQIQAREKQPGGIEEIKIPFWLAMQKGFI